MQETWLDDSVESINVKGYRVVSRRDRIDGYKSGYGGVVTLVREDVFNVVEIFKAENAERVSCTIHTNLGPVLVNLYRPPDDDAYTSLPTFRNELAALMEDHVGTIVTGDLNIHHRKWLRFSNANTAAGRMLQQICEHANLCQLVNAPTRKEYLLDLVITDLVTLMHVDVSAPIADHSMVSMVMDINTVATENAERNIWIFKQAKWHALRTELNAIAWHDVFGKDFSENASKFTEIVLSSSNKKKHIPFRKHRFRKSLHPWLTDTAFEAIQAKVVAYGTCSYDDAANACCQVLARVCSSCETSTHNTCKFAPKIKKMVEAQQGTTQQTESHCINPNLSRRMSNGCTHRRTRPIH